MSTMHLLAQADGSAGGTAGSAPAPAPVASSSSSTPQVQQAQLQAVSTSPASPRPTGVRATSTAAPSAPAAAAATSTPSSSAPIAPPTGANNPFLIPAIVGALALAAIGAYAALRARTRANNSKDDQQKNDDGRCDNIKQLLEQKKKELEDMVRGWPEEKIKAMVQGKILETAKNTDSDVKAAIELAERAKSEYDKLTSTIAILEKRLDLCMLSLPGKNEKVYNGTIVENSLNDKEVLKNIKILKTYTTGDWTVHDVSVNAEQLKKLGEYLNDGPWYMHFWEPGKDKLIAVFKERQFEMKQSDKATWRDAVEHGKKKGIPEAQLDFRTN